MIFDAPDPEAEDYPWAAMLRRALLAGLSSADFWAMSPAGVMAVSGGPLRPPSQSRAARQLPRRGGHASPFGIGEAMQRRGGAADGATEREPVRLGSLTDCPF